LVRPVITIGLVVPLAAAQVVPPSSENWYPVIVRSPALPAVKGALMLPSPTVRALSVGAPGRARGVTSTRGEDAAPVPALFVAATST